jgi:hypothetical protein
MKQVSSLESQVSDLMAKIVHLKECNSFLVEIIESACEQLQCEFLKPPCAFLLRSCGFICCNFFILQVLARILSTRIVGFLSEMRLLRGHRRIPTLFGLTRGVAVPLFFCKIVLSILENPSMVVKNL